MDQQRADDRGGRWDGDFEDIPVDPDLAPDDPAEPSVHRPRLRRRQRHGRAQPGVLAAISLGGMLGASARYGVSRAIHDTAGTFPWATFWANVSGAFLLGFLLVMMLERFPPSTYLRPFVATGFLGAFTTMSTFQVETVTLFKDGHLLTAIVYALGTLIAGLIAAYAGFVVGRIAPVGSRGRRAA